MSDGSVKKVGGWCCECESKERDDDGDLRMVVMVVNGDCK